jgi:hypothetical protein
MKPIHTAGALAALAALAVPAAASAHPSVYTDVAKVEQPANSGTFVDQTRHVVTNHGFTMVLRENNGLAAPKGVITYSKLPSNYRKTIPFSQWQAEGGTGAQAHATCQVPALESEEAIKDWQEGDPFYNYVPFQKGSAGLEDDPATWIPVVMARTGVDLATVADPAAACVGIGGTYTPADQTQTTAAAMASGTVEQATAPLTAQVDSLTKAVGDAEAARVGVQRLLDAANSRIAELTAMTAPMTLALPSARADGDRLARRGTQVTVSGAPNAPVTVRLSISGRNARKLGLKSAVLASAKATLGAGGQATVALMPKRSTRKALRGLKRAIGMTVTARSSDRIASSGGTITR